MPSPIAPTETQTKEDEYQNSTSPRLDVDQDKDEYQNSTSPRLDVDQDEAPEMKRANTIRVSQTSMELSTADKARFNGRSQIGMKELIQTQSDKEKAVAQNKQLKKVVAVLSIAVLVLCAGAFAASFAAIQMAKESHVKDGVMYASEDPSTQDMANGAAQYEVRSVVSTGTSSVKVSFEKLAAFAAEGKAGVEPLLSDIDTVYYKSIFGELLHNKVTKAWLSGTSIVLVLALDEEGKPSTMKIFKDHAHLQHAKSSYSTSGNVLIRLTPQSQGPYQLMLASNGNSARRLQADNSELVVSSVERTNDRAEFEEMCQEMAAMTLQGLVEETSVLTTASATIAQKFCDLRCQDADALPRCVAEANHCQDPLSFRNLAREVQLLQLAEACRYENNGVWNSIIAREEALNDALDAHNGGRRLSAAYGSARRLKTVSGNGTSPTRRLGDYGWCSMAFDFLAGGADTSNYCDDAQNCDSSHGCGNAVDSCCIGHDMCLQSTTGTGRCPKTNCKGASCDATLSSCAWGVKCYTTYKCGWFNKFTCYDWDERCTLNSGVIAALFALGDYSPQAGWNTGGDDC